LTPESEDEIPEDNSNAFEFEVSDTLFAKEFGTELVPRTLSDMDNYDCSVANVFYVPNGEGYFARYISFGVENPDELAGRSVTIFLNEWDGGMGAGTADRPDPEDWGGGPIAFNSYTFSGDENNLNYITIPIDIDEQGVALQDGYYYMLGVQYDSDDDQGMAFWYTTGVSYDGMELTRDSLGNGIRYGTMVADGANEWFYSGGWSDGIIALIQMSISDESVLVKTPEPQLPENAVHIYPNPVGEQLKVGLSFEELSENVMLRVYTADGKDVFFEQYEKVVEGLYEFNTENLPNGNYFLRVNADKGMRTLKFVVQH